MKQLERLITITCILLVLGLAVQYGSRKLLPVITQTFELGPREAITVTLALQQAFSLLVPLAIAVFLYREAKRDREFPWVWVLLALTYQYIAPIFYLALKLYRGRSAATGTEPAAS